MKEFKIRVQTQDNKVYEIEESVSGMSSLLTEKLIEYKLEASKAKDKNYTAPVLCIPEKHVTGEVIEQVLKWCRHHISNPQDDIFDDDSEDEDGDRYGLQVSGTQLRWQRRFVWIPEWDKRFLSSMDQGTLFGVITAANYFKLKRLLSISSQTVANMMRGKSPETIRQMFNIKNDYDPCGGDLGDDDEIQFIGSDHTRTRRGEQVVASLMHYNY